jgi:hypothetical protein
LQPLVYAVDETKNPDLGKNFYTITYVWRASINCSLFCYS